MGKKFKLSIKKPKCPGCGRRLQISKRQSNANKGKITGYCFQRELHDGKVQKWYLEIEISKEPEADEVGTAKQLKSDLD